MRLARPEPVEGRAVVPDHSNEWSRHSMSASLKRSPGKDIALSPEPSPWPRVVVAIALLERDRRVEQRAQGFGREHGSFGARRRDPSVTQQDDAVDFGDDFLDVVRDQDERRPFTRDLPDALHEV